MEFVREKIKEKPINKRRIALKMGIAALCGITFSVVVCLILAIAVPMIQSSWETENSELGIPTESEEETQDKQETENVTIVHPNQNMTITDFQILQDELHKTGNDVNKSIVTVMQVENENDWTQNGQTAIKAGAGVIISVDSNYIYILTEHKLIADAKAIKVSFVDNAEATARLFKYDGNTGITILTVEKRLLSLNTKSAITVARFGRSNDVTNGALVIALGSPIGTNYSILTGNIISVESEVVTVDKNYDVYTTNIVASKNGSGVLVNTKGEIIGWMKQEYGVMQDISTVTAIAISEIDEIIDLLKNGKNVPYVGIHMSTVTDEIAEAYDIPKGVYISEVIADSPAMKSGLQSGDVITQINGERIETDTAVSEKISQLIPGTTCEITVKRQSGNSYYEVTFEVTIGILQ